MEMNLDIFLGRSKIKKRKRHQKTTFSKITSREKEITLLDSCNSGYTKKRGAGVKPFAFKGGDFEATPFRNMTKGMAGLFDKDDLIVVGRLFNSIIRITNDRCSLLWRGISSDEKDIAFLIPSIHLLDEIDDTFVLLTNAIDDGDDQHFAKSDAAMRRRHKCRWLCRVLERIKNRVEKFIHETCRNLVGNICSKSFSTKSFSNLNNAPISQTDHRGTSIKVEISARTDNNGPQLSLAGPPAPSSDSVQTEARSTSTSPRIDLSPILTVEGDVLTPLLSTASKYTSATAVALRVVELVVNTALDSFLDALLVAAPPFDESGVLHLYLQVQHLLNWVQDAKNHLGLGTGTGTGVLIRERRAWRRADAVICVLQEATLPSRAPSSSSSSSSHSTSALVSAEGKGGKAGGVGDGRWKMRWFLINPCLGRKAVAVVHDMGPPLKRSDKINDKNNIPRNSIGVGTATGGTGVGPAEDNEREPNSSPASGRSANVNVDGSGAVGTGVVSSASASRPLLAPVSTGRGAEGPQSNTHESSAAAAPAVWESAMGSRSKRVAFSSPVAASSPSVGVAGTERGSWEPPARNHPTKGSSSATHSPSPLGPGAGAVVDGAAKQKIYGKKDKLQQRFRRENENDEGGGAEEAEGDGDGDGDDRQSVVGSEERARWKALAGVGSRTWDTRLGRSLGLVGFVGLWWWGEGRSRNKGNKGTVFVAMKIDMAQL